MKKYRVNKDLVFYVSNVLDRRAIDHQMIREKDGHYCLVDMGSNKFHKVVIRASMERITLETGAPISYIAKVEQRDLQVLTEVGSAYAVIKFLGGCAYGL